MKNIIFAAVLLTVICSDFCLKAYQICSTNIDEIQLLLESNGEKDTKDKKQEKSEDSHYVYFAINAKDKFDNLYNVDVRTNNLISQQYFKKIPVPPPNVR